MEFIQGEKFARLARNATIYHSRAPEVSQLTDNIIYHSHIHDVNHFFDTCDKEKEFILISHNSDASVTDGIKRFDSADINKMPKNLKKWYTQNLDVEHDLIESIPIGLENSEWFVETRKIEKLKNIVNTEKNIKNLVYLNLNVNNNPVVRAPIYKLLIGKKYVTVEYGRNGIDFDHYLQNLYNHCFMVCPEGNGIDVHQPWESMYINTIPIQKKNINNKNWRELPVCWLDDWRQLEDESFLLSEYERITNSVFDKSKLDFNYWKNKILTT